MITLTRFHQDNHPLIINADLIESIEAVPDTVVTLVTRHRHMVQETPAQIIELVIEYHAAIAAASVRAGERASGARAAHALQAVEEDKI